jgi:O-antigen/teichoic acid export membrane protein
MAADDRPAHGARRLVHTFVSLVGAEIVTRGLVLVTGLVIARALDPARFGDFSYAFGVALVAGLLVDLGLAALVIRDVSADPDTAPEVLGSYLRVQALLALGTFAFVAVLTLAGIVGGPASKEAILLATGAVCLGGMSRPFEAVMTGGGKAHLVTISRSVRGAALVAATVVVALAEPGVDAFLVAWVCAEAAGVATVAVISMTRAISPARGRSWSGVRRLLRLALPFALVTAASVLYLRVDLLMLGHLDTAVAVGNYGIASRVMDAAVVIPAFFGNAFLATVAQTGARTERGRMQTTEAIRWVMLITAPVVIALAGVAGPIVHLITGGGYTSADDALVRLAPVALTTASYGVLVSLQVALDQIGLLFKLFAAGLVVKIAANAYAIPAFGLRGAAVSASLVEVLVAAAQWWSARRYFDAGKALVAVLRILMAAAAGLAATIALRDALPWPLALAAGLAVYGAVVVAARVVSAGEVRQVWSSAGPGGA